MSTKFNASLVKLAAALEAAHQLEAQAVAKATEARKKAINFALDCGRAEDQDPGTIRDAIAKIFESAVNSSQLTASTARTYMSGVRFALERRLAWNPALHSAEGQITALQDAGRKVPDHLKAKAAALAAKKEPKPSAAQVANADSVVRHLAKALADSRTLGKSEWAADILDCIHAIQPEWKEPAAPL